MPHQNVTSSNATAQNQATDPIQPNDEAREQNVSVRAEPSSYAAPDVADSTVAAPAAGEMADYMDEGEALDADGLQRGRSNANRPGRTEAAMGQGPKTREANQRIVKGE